MRRGESEMTWQNIPYPSRARLDESMFSVTVQHPYVNCFVFRESETRRLMSNEKIRRQACNDIFIK